MQKRTWAAVAAAALAAVGAGLLTVYVQNAEARAMAGQQPTSVLVVVKEVARGTSADQLGNTVASRQLPAMAIAPGAASSVAELAGKVAAVNLLPGEQVLASRFIDPQDQLPPDDVLVPDGLEQVSVRLAPERALGARLQAGQRVGIIASFELDGGEGGRGVAATRLMLPKVLVTRVQGVVKAEPDSGEAPSEEVMVTFAMSAGQAEQLVHAGEFGKIWLTLQGARSSQADSRLVTASKVLR